MERRVLITGGSRGLGAAIAEISARLGWTNLLVSRSEHAMRELLEKWRKEGFARPHACLAQDLTAPDAVQRMIRWFDNVGYPDTVIHNAAIGSFGLFGQTGSEKHADTIALGVSITVQLTHALLPHLEKTPGSCIVYIGSTAGRKPVPYMNVYSSTKAFVHNFALALREELRGRPPKVLLAIPGAIQTDFPKLAGLPESFAENGLSAPVAAEIIVRAIDTGRDGVLQIGTFKERYGAILQRLLPPTFWARTMCKRYRPLVHRNTF